MTKRSNAIRPRGYPDRRGMGAQSDFIVEQFVPSEEYKARQGAMVKKLVSAGVSAEDLARMFHVRSDLLSAEKAQDK